MTGAWSQAPRHTIGSSVKRPSAVVSPGLMPRRAAQVLAQMVVAHDPATDAVAEQDHVPAHRPAENQVVECRDARPARPESSPAASAMSRNASSDTQPRCCCTIFIASMQTRAAVRIVRELGLDLGPLLFSVSIVPLSVQSSVDVRQHEIHAAQNGHQIGDHQPAADQRHHLHDAETKASECVCGRTPCCRRSPGNSRCCPWSPRCPRTLRPAESPAPS